MRVLLLQDDPARAMELSTILRSADLMVKTASSSDDILHLMLHSHWDVALSDASSIGEASSIIHAMRSGGVHVPVLIVSGSAQPRERAQALSLGADDFVSEPFDKNELLARLAAVARRHRSPERTVLTIGPVKLDRSMQEAKVGNITVPLTSREFSVLELLVLRRGVVLTKGAILSQLYSGHDEPDAKIIDVFICKIRKKLAHAGCDNPVGTVWGQGYIVRDPDGGGVRSPSPSSAISVEAVAA